MKQTKANKNVTLSYSHVDNRSGTLFDSGSFSNYFSNQLAISYPIYSGGNLEGLIHQADLNLTVAELELAAARQQLQLKIVTYYFNVLEYRNEARICQATVDNYTDHLNLVKTKYDLGMVAKTEVLSSQVNLADAQDSLIKVQNNYSNAVATLNNALGLPHDSELVLKDDFKYEKTGLILEQCLTYAETHRPEIVQYESKIASAEAGVQIARSGYLPTVNLTLSQGWKDNNFPGFKKSNCSVGLVTSLDLWDAGLTKSKVRQAEFSLAKTRDQARQNRDSILLDVRQYYLSMQEAKKRIETSTVSVNQAEENLTIEKLRYDVGAGTGLDVRDAVLALDKARKNYTQALYDYDTAKANLDQAMGLPVQ
ncbi:TolC family protein [Sporomusa ovata]|uniref:TolC family protein n=1 Tax=Sporomusa ovata TaxID=2378 RepID=UPI001F2B0600|nr:TolC family protein [Sporomusa ovata]